MRSSIWSIGATLFVGAFCTVGCGDRVEPIANLVPVNGTVAFNGKPLEHGTVTFFPKFDVGQPATGKIKNGKFTMITTVSAPGVVAGEYNVRIESTDAAASMPITAPPKPGEKVAGPKSLIPEKYNNAMTSGLEVNAFDGMEDLTWDLKP